MMERPTYQLTKHSIGSLKEVWAISWPLIVSLLSFGSMIFVDRLLLSYHSLQSLNIITNAGTAAFLFLAAPSCIVAITEVFVGRYHGEGLFSKAGSPVWQMIWFSLLITPAIWILGWILGPFIFANNNNESLEISFFRINLFFAPIFMAEIVLSGFFVGIGHIKTITIGVILANLLNFVFDIFLIFGLGPIPSMGVSGAPLATGLAQTFLVGFFMFIFLSKKNRNLYKTSQLHIDFALLKEAVCVGAPASFGRFMETLAHLTFFRIMILAGEDNLTIASVMQSIYILLNFFISGLSQGVTSLISNLLGGQQEASIIKVIKSAFVLHILFFVLIYPIFALFGCQILNLFLHNKLTSIGMFNYDNLQWCFLWMSIYYLFDGFAWILMGHLTAATDTKFIFYTILITNWLLFIMPTFIAIYFFEASVIHAWVILGIFAFCNFIIYVYRYRSDQWKKCLQRSCCIT